MRNLLIGLRNHDIYIYWKKNKPDATQPQESTSLVKVIFRKEYIK
jgi:hypothetical protein